MPLSLRDRFFTPAVAKAMMSPSAILATGAGAAVGILVGGPLGGIAGGIAAWSARVGLAIPGSPTTERIDPFTIAEPWRRFVQDALGAQVQFAEAVRRALEGPIRERLSSLSGRIDESVKEVWENARAGHELADASRRIDAQGAVQEFHELVQSGAVTADGQLGPNASRSTPGTLAALRAQLETADRIRNTVATTADQLRLLNARLDEAVTRCIELGVGRFSPDEFNDLEANVGSITDELEALRSALESTSQSASSRGSQTIS
jgi:hypothetical protein